MGPHGFSDRPWGLGVIKNTWDPGAHLGPWGSIKITPGTLGLPRTSPHNLAKPGAFGYVGANQPIESPFDVKQANRWPMSDALGERLQHMSDARVNDK